MATEVGTLSTKGQVTIPKDVRDALRLRAGDKIRFDIEEGSRAIIQKAEPSTLTEILSRLGASRETGVEYQRRLRRDWLPRNRRH